MECSICLETVPLSRCVTCPYCSKQTVCYGCNYTNLKTTAPESGCTLCKTRWTRLALSKILTKQDYKTYTALCNKLKLQKEKATINESSYLIPHIKAADLLLNEYDRLVRAVNDAKENIVEAQKRLHYLKPNQYRFKCPSKCTGWVDEENEYCIVCGHDICIKCIQVLHPQKRHKCKTDDVSTINEIKLNTRPCPKCYINIGKTEGCSTMYCTNCDTAFDWYTLDIVKGKFHNPEHQDLIKTGKIKESKEDRFVGEYRFIDFNNTRIPDPFSNLITQYGVLEALFGGYYDMIEEMQGVKRTTKARILMKHNDINELNNTLVRVLDKENYVEVVIEQLNNIKMILENAILLSCDLEDRSLVYECYDRTTENVRNIAKDLGKYMADNDEFDHMLSAFIMAIVY